MVLASVTHRPVSALLRIQPRTNQALSARTTTEAAVITGDRATSNAR